MSIFWSFWLGLGGLLLGAVLSTLHLALRDIASVRLNEMTAGQKRSRTAERVHAILADLEGHETAVALPRSIANAIGIVAVVQWVMLELPTAHIALSMSVGIALAVTLMWVFGSVIAQSIAVHAGERVVCATSPLIRSLYAISMPLRRATGGIDEIIRRLVGASHDNGEELEAELLSVIEEGEREGQFDETERLMIASVVKFRTSSVDQIMTPRTDVEAFELSDDPDAVRKLIANASHSRIPVYEDSVDKIVGVLYARDVLLALATPDPNAPLDLRSLLRPAVFVPETKTVRDLLKELIGRRVHIAIVLDEYGGTAGLVTIEDIVEEIFGEIQDEYDTEEDEPPSVNLDEAEEQAEVDARIHIDDLNSALKPIGIQLPESEEYDTLGGYLLSLLGRIPETGEIVRQSGAKFTIASAEATRIERVVIAKRHEDEETLAEPVVPARDDAQTQPAADPAEAASIASSRESGK